MSLGSFVRKYFSHHYGLDELAVKFRLVDSLQSLMSMSYVFYQVWVPIVGWLDFTELVPEFWEFIPEIISVVCTGAGKPTTSKIWFTRYDLSNEPQSIPLLEYASDDNVLYTQKDFGVVHLDSGCQWNIYSDVADAGGSVQVMIYGRLIPNGIEKGVIA